MNIKTRFKIVCHKITEEKMDINADMKIFC